MRSSREALSSRTQLIGQSATQAVTPARGSLRAIHTPASSMGKRWLPPWKWSWERMEPPTMGRSALEPMK